MTAIRNGVRQERVGAARSQKAWDVRVVSGDVVRGVGGHGAEPARNDTGPRVELQACAVK